MTGDLDDYEAYYADKLWNLLPSVYRSLDTDQFNANGPLRELVNRIGAQAAVLRRSLDRMWDDQSIETCDDWVIPYIGDLLATNLVTNLDPAGQRVDVAKTIYYRRRKGTVAILEEIATNITQWDAKVVEFFRRLGRTRHGLDPSLGIPAQEGDDVDQLLIAEGLVGPLTRTAIGGLADLRNSYGASKTGTAFDEFFHTADVRLGQGREGWYNIPRLGVFLWRLQSFGVSLSTPVAVKGCPAGWFAFDPTGREIPLYAASERTADSYGDNWVSPVESQLPTPISQALFDTSQTFPLYPNSLAVYPGRSSEPIDVSRITARPERGLFFANLTPAGPVSVSYHYGFASQVGAGPYDRRLGRVAPPSPDPQASLAGGKDVGTLPRSGTVTFKDSMTYTVGSSSQTVTVAGGLTLRAGVEQRPVIRFLATIGQWLTWTFHGLPGADSNCLVIDGLLISGVDLVLTGSFDCVKITCSTLDPGTSTHQVSSPPASSGPFGTTVDGHPLAPCRLWVEGTVGTLTIERAIIGPIRTRNGGSVGTLTALDSIIQAIPTSTPGPILVSDIKDPTSLEERLGGTDPVSVYLRSLSTGLRTLPDPISVPPPYSPPLPVVTLVKALNLLISGPSIDNPKALAGVLRSSATIALEAGSGHQSELNRSLLEDAYPLELSDLALGFEDGDVSLSRCTVIGRVVVHHLEVSECILQDLVEVDDIQHGCVRFSAWADQSVLPRQYESVRIAQGAAIFTSTDYGQPGFGQLILSVDEAILATSGPASPGTPTIASGASDGSEMGAFARERYSIKERGLLIKYLEYMPAGLVPVLIYVT